MLEKKSSLAFGGMSNYYVSGLCVYEGITDAELLIEVGLATSKTCFCLGGLFLLSGAQFRASFCTTYSSMAL